MPLAVGDRKTPAVTRRPSVVMATTLAPASAAADGQTALRVRADGAAEAEVADGAAVASEAAGVSAVVAASAGDAGNARKLHGDSEALNASKDRKHSSMVSCLMAQRSGFRLNFLQQAGEAGRGTGPGCAENVRISG